VTNAARARTSRSRAPEIAENGAVVPIDITSNIPGTTSISVFIDKNPFPYTGTFDLFAGRAAVRAPAREDSASPRRSAWWSPPAASTSRPRRK